jgi:hypothetical protein
VILCSMCARAKKESNMRETIMVLEGKKGELNREQL